MEYIAFCKSYDVVKEIREEGYQKKEAYIHYFKFKANNASKAKARAEKILRSFDRTKNFIIGKEYKKSSLEELFKLTKVKI